MVLTSAARTAEEENQYFSEGIDSRSVGNEFFDPRCNFKGGEEREREREREWSEERGENSSQVMKYR